MSYDPQAIWLEKWETFKEYAKRQLEFFEKQGEPDGESILH